MQEHQIESWAFGATLLGLPVVVAGADLLVPIRAGGHAQTLCAAFLAEEHARLLERGLGASVGASRRAVLRAEAPLTVTVLVWMLHFRSW